MCIHAACLSLIQNSQTLNLLTSQSGATLIVLLSVSFNQLNELYHQVSREVQVDDGPCVMHIGPGGSGNFVKMVHNGIEYGDMQLISEAYDVLRTVGGLNNEELAETFTLWNKVQYASLPHCWAASL